MMAAQRANSAVKVWMVGSIGIDDVATRDTARADLLGGSLPFATAAASFFTTAGAVGVVGDDFPDAFHKRWRAFGADLTGVARQAGPTFRWACRYDDNMIERVTLRTELGVFADFKPCLPEQYRQAPFVLLGNIQPELQMHVLKQAIRPRFVALDTMNLWIEIARPALLRVIRKANLLTINDGEARMLTGRWGLLDCAADLLKMGPAYVLVKKGEHGALLASRRGVILAPAYPVRNLSDPTGAGDVFAGALMGYVARAGRVTDRVMRDALVHASVLASFGVEGFSIERLERLTAREIKERVRRLRRMMATAG